MNYLVNLYNCYHYFRFHIMYSIFINIQITASKICVKVFDIHNYIIKTLHYHESGFGALEV